MAGLILAGGEGRRFGGPKAWAELPDGQSFLTACAAALLGGGAAPVVATLPPGSHDPGVDGLDTAPLPERDLDMFASAQVGLRRLLEHGIWNRVAVLPVDHPLVRPGTVAALAACDGPAVIPSCAGKHGHPVVLDRSTAAAVAGGSLPGPTLRDVLVEVGVAVLEVDDLGTVANCNTPGALRRALARGDDR